MKFKQKCSECLAFKQFLMPVIQNIKVETHLTLIGTCWSQELPVEHMEAIKIHEINNQNANTVPWYAVEAT